MEGLLQLLRPWKLKNGPIDRRKQNKREKLLEISLFMKENSLSNCSVHYLNAAYCACLKKSTLNLAEEKMGYLELKPGGLSYGSKLGESCNRTLFDYITTIHEVQQINLITFFELEQTMGYLILHGFQGPKELCWEKYNVNSVCVCVYASF